MIMVCVTLGLLRFIFFFSFFAFLDFSLICIENRIEGLRDRSRSHVFSYLRDVSLRGSLVREFQLFGWVVERFITQDNIHFGKVVC